METLPLLLRSSTPRHPEPVLPGRYCDKRMMWVVTTSRGEVPAIEAPSVPSMLKTKTRTTTEQDDDPTVSMVNMLQTKTEAELEREDEAICSMLASLQTKKARQQEADDTSEMLV